MKKNLTIKEIFDLAVEHHKKNNFKVAENLYRDILKLQPNHFDTIYLLGSLSLQNKDFNNAKQLLQKAIKINSNHADAHNNLGIAFAELKEREKAINCFENVIKIQPKNAAAFNNLGTECKNLGKFKEAVNFYQKAIDIKPNYAIALHNLGLVFETLGELQKAKVYYEKAIDIQPNDAVSYNNLGVVFNEMGELQKAQSCYQKAIKIQPNFGQAHSNLGLKYKALGEREKAIKCFEKATKCESKKLVHFYYLSELKKEILNTNLKNKIIDVIKKDNPEKSDSAYGNFLLSKYEREIKNYEKELNYLLRGHLYYFEIKKGKFATDVNEWLNVLPKITKLINLDKSDNNIKKINEKIKPIFLIGVPRCGSTLVEKIIASGAKYIPVGEETTIIHEFLRHKILNNDSSNLDKENFQKKIIENYMKRGLIQKKSNYTFTDKSLENFFYVNLIKEIFPYAKVINCRRNTLSSIMSIFQNNLTALAWTHDLENIFKYFNNYFEIINNFNKVDSNFIYELEYEKLVNEPEKEAKKLMKFCGLPWDKKCLEFYKRKDLISRTASNIQIKEPIYKDSLNKYLPYKKFLNKYGKKYSWFN